MDKYLRAFLRSKRTEGVPIIIYGTGIIAKNVINGMPKGSNVVAVMDGEKKEGVFCNYKIIDWDEIEPLDKGIIIIAASSINYETIYYRIYSKVLKKDFLIIGTKGERLDSLYWGGEKAYLFPQIKINNWDNFGEIIVAPILVEFMEGLLEYIAKTNFDGKILFAARDCYVFFKLYQIVKKNMSLDLPEGIYLNTSRASALNICGYEKQKYIKENVYKNKESELDYSEINYLNLTQDNYREYLYNLGIKKDDELLFCEFYSKGTTQYLLEDIYKNIKGYYYMHSCMDIRIPVKVNAKYNINREHYVFDNYNMVTKEVFIENLLAAPVGKFLGIDADGMPVYAADKRTPRQLEIISRIQNASIKFASKHLFRGEKYDVEANLSYLNGRYKYSKDIDITLLD